MIALLPLALALPSPDSVKQSKPSHTALLPFLDADATPICKTWGQGHTTPREYK